MAACVVNSDGLIVNRVVLGDGAEWAPPEGHSLVEETSSPMSIGGTYRNGVYTPPADPAADAQPT